MEEKTVQTRFPVVVQRWEERERGMGSRPDGYSLHLSESDRKAYVTAVFDKRTDEVPDAYDAPDGSPYITDVDAETYARLKSGQHGLRFSGVPPKAS